MDVDVLVYLGRDTEGYRKLLIAVSYVAVEKHVDYHWLSDGIGDLMAAAAVGQVPEGKLWLRSGLLELIRQKLELFRVRQNILLVQKLFPDFSG